MSGGLGARKLPRIIQGMTAMHEPITRRGNRSGTGAPPLRFDETCSRLGIAGVDGGARKLATPNANASTLSRLFSLIGASRVAASALQRVRSLHRVCGAAATDTASRSDEAFAFSMAAAKGAQCS